MIYDKLIPCPRELVELVSKWKQYGLSKPYHHKKEQVMTIQGPVPTNEIRKEFKAGFWHWAVMILAGLYTLLGTVDILPDVIPIIGELDDIGALVLFLRMAAPVFNTNFGIKA